MDSDENNKRLGEQLLDAGLVTKNELKKALHEQEDVDERLGTILIKRGLISEEKLVEFLSRQTGHMVVNLNNYPVQDEVAELISEKQARRYRAIPIYKDNQVLIVAMQDPLDLVAIDDLSMLTNMEIEPAIATASEIERFIESAYGSSDDGQTDVRPLRIVGDSDDISFLQGTPQSSGPAVQMVQQIITDALDDGITNVHLDSKPDRTQVKFRDNGFIRHYTDLPSGMLQSIQSRFTVLAERAGSGENEEDRSIRVVYGDEPVTIRLNSIETQLGGKLMIEIHRAEHYNRELTDLGMDESAQSKLRNLLDTPRGLILYTGPDDSGKTTSMYASLRYLSQKQQSITTVEDPVEHELSFCSQTQVERHNQKQKSTAILNALAVDPDVIMISDVTDMGVAQTAVQAAVTGRKILTSSYANNAVDALYQFGNMESIDQHLFANSVTGVVAQRLVRIPSSAFKEKYTPKPEDLNRFNLPESRTYSRVRDTGLGKSPYEGVTGIFQVLPVTDRMRNCILNDRSYEDFVDAANQTQFQSLREKGVQKILDDVTTIEEVKRVTFREDFTQDFHSASP